MRKITFMIAALAATISMNAQDDCANAMAVTDGSYTIDAVNGDTPIDCYEYTSGDVPSAGEWYSYTVGADDLIVTISSGGNATVVDTRLSVYTGDCSDLTCYAANDDINFDGGNYLSEVSFFAEAGMTYYFTFDDTWSADGFDFEVSSSTEVPDLPGTASNPTPEDDATDVPVDGNEGPNGEAPTNRVAFAFDAPAEDGGSPLTGYELYLSEPNGTEVSSIGVVPADGGNTDYGFINMEPNSTYMWKAVPLNIAGGDEENAPVWTFTTGEILDVATPEVVDSFSYFNTNETLNLQAQQTIENVTLFNLLGQQVVSQEVNTTEGNVNIANLNAGVYIAQVQVEGKTQTFKFVKK